MDELINFTKTTENNIVHVNTQVQKLVNTVNQFTGKMHMASKATEVLLEHTKLLEKKEKAYERMVTELVPRDLQRTHPVNRYM